MQFRDFILELEAMLKSTESVCSDDVSYVRSEAFVNGQYKSDTEYEGQHDAAEFLGNVLWGTTFAKWGLIRHKSSKYAEYGL